MTYGYQNTGGLDKGHLDSNCVFTVHHLVIYHLLLSKAAYSELRYPSWVNSIYFEGHFGVSVSAVFLQILLLSPCF